jgi:type II secretory pathway pseudopilin PulG
MKNQNGITLIELLTVLAISSMVVILAISIFTSMMKISDKSINHTYLRNESVLIIHQLDEFLMNTDTININGEADPEGNFTSFYAINKTSELTTNEKNEDVFVDKEQYTLLNIVSGDLLLFPKCSASGEEEKSITCEEGSKQRINSESYSVSDTFFTLKGNGLFMKLIVVDNEKNTKFEVSKLYSVQSE